MKKQLGWLSLSGLMIGPIMGSGIILIPGLAYKTAGIWSVPAWGVMVLAGFVFAFIFSFLTLISPGDAGVTNAVERAFGPKAKVLSAYFLILAGLFGPPAAFLIGAKYANPFAMSDPKFAFWSAVICFMLSNMSVTSLGRAAFALSCVSVVTLFASGAYTLFLYHGEPIPHEPFQLPVFGDALLILFWIIIGWEVIGSFSGEVKNPQKTYVRAAVFSALVIGAVDMVVAGGVLMGSLGGLEADVRGILFPVFGGWSFHVLAVLAYLLCMNTTLSFIGSISRLASSMAEAQHLPPILSERNSSGAPFYGISAYLLVHTFMLYLVSAGVMDMEKLVSAANAFFISNAITGLLAAAKLFRRAWLKTLALCLTVFLAGILLFSHWSLLLAIALTVLYVFRKKSPQADADPLPLRR